MATRAPPTARGTASTVAVALLLAISVCLAGVVGGALVTATPKLKSPSPAAFSLSVSENRLVFTHEAGSMIDVRRLVVHVRVDGTPLARQPPVPFFAASGFASGPTGPFNSAADPYWSPGETASFEPATTNSPSIRPGAAVEVRFVVNGATIATLDARCPPRESPPSTADRGRRRRPVVARPT